MNFRIVALVLAITGTVIGCSGGSTIRPTTKPKLPVGWKPYESWKNNFFMGLPPNYLEYALGSRAMSNFLRDLDEKFPEMKKMIQEKADAEKAPERVITVLEMDHGKLPEFVDHFTVDKKMGWPKKALPDFLAAVNKDPTNYFPGAKVVTAEQHQHPNGAIARVEYETAMEIKGKKPKTLHSTAYVLISGDDSHVVTFTTIKQRLSTSRKVFDEAIQTFRVTAG
jgi:hypothetical protein